MAHVEAHDMRPGHWPHAIDWRAAFWAAVVGGLIFAALVSRARASTAAEWFCSSCFASWDRHSVRSRCSRDHHQKWRTAKAMRAVMITTGNMAKIAASGESRFQS